MKEQFIEFTKTVICIPLLVVVALLLSMVALIESVVSLVNPGWDDEFDWDEE